MPEPRTPSRFIRGSPCPCATGAGLSLPAQQLQNRWKLYYLVPAGSPSGQRCPRRPAARPAVPLTSPEELRASQGKGLAAHRCLARAGSPLPASLQPKKLHRS